MKCFSLAMLLAIIQAVAPVPRKTSDSVGDTSTGVQNHAKTNQTSANRQQAPINANPALNHNGASNEHGEENGDHPINVGKLPTVSVKPDWGMAL